MDPTATLYHLLEEFERGADADREEIRHYLLNLERWVARQGFLPIVELCDSDSVSENSRVYNDHGIWYVPPTTERTQR